MAHKLAGNILDDLLGTNPGVGGAPEIFFKLVSQRFREIRDNEGHGAEVDLIFGKRTQEDDDLIDRDRVTLTYATHEEAGWSLENVKKDCAALARLGFDTLDVHRS